MRIYYFVHEAATPEDRRVAAALRDEGHIVTINNACRLRKLADVQGADRVVYNGIEVKHVNLLEHFCGILSIFCDPAIPEPMPHTAVPLQLEPVKNADSTVIRRKAGAK